MLSLSPSGLLHFLQSFPAEAIGVASFTFCASMILLLQKQFGLVGLCVYNVVAVMAANLAALKLGQFHFFKEPVALGTVVFASTFLVTDLITEYYGKEIAQKSIWLGFLSALLWMGMNLFVLAVKPLEPTAVHEAMALLFTPTPAIVAASLISYLISQQLDVTIFHRVKILTAGKALWLRTSLSTSCSALIDSALFSTLAWVVFAPKAVELPTLIHTYILGTFVFRLLALIANIGVMYLARIIIDKHKATQQYVPKFSF